ncbi:MAG: type II secretion system F family protein [Candidatus Diapherotrites archaeon]
MPQDNIQKMKKALEEQKKAQASSAPKRIESVDPRQVERIVEKMKQKYASEGVPVEEVKGSLAELRTIIAEGGTAKVQIQTVEELREFKSPLVKALGNFYLTFKLPLDGLKRIIRGLPPVRDLGFQLYSANMNFSLQQYLALATTVSALVGLLFLILAAFVFMFMSVPLGLAIILTIFVGIFGFIFSALIALLYPRSKAQQRGEAVSAELPFALRHMSTELKAGIGLFRTIQAIAQADYGPLSEEFARVVTEIEEGTDAKDALKNLALRTQSRALRNALLHVIRAMKTGGNLSQVMSEIAEDVSFEIRSKVRDFAEKMNFFGVIFIFMAIVAPVMVAIFASIRNAPLGQGGVSFMAALPLTPMVVALFYVVAMPLVLAYLFLYLKMAQPKI